MLAGGGSAPFEVQAPMIKMRGRWEAVDQIAAVGSDIAIAANANEVGLLASMYGGRTEP